MAVPGSFETLTHGDKLWTVALRCCVMKVFVWGNDVVCSPILIAIQFFFRRGGALKS